MLMEEFMATTERKKQLIARNASDLAFSIGQAIQRNLIGRALRRAAERNADMVTTEDVEAAAVELCLSSVRGMTGDAAHGEENRAGPDAA
jgi:hypothetical protein